MSDWGDPRLIDIPAPNSTWPAGAPLGLSGYAVPRLAGDATGLRLPVDPEGAFRLDCADGSLGRLTLPRGTAIDRKGRVYLLDPWTGLIRRYDATSPSADPNRPFTVLPAVGGPMRDMPDDPRRFHFACSIAVDAESLYVADSGSRRTLVFALETWALQDIWIFNPPECTFDVTVHGGVIYILSADAVYSYRRGDDGPTLLIRRYENEPAWRRLAVDLQGRLYILPQRSETVPLALLVYRVGSAEEHPVIRESDVHDPAEVRDRFPFPALYTIPDEQAGRPVWYVMPGTLTNSCRPTLPTTSPGSIESAFTRRPNPAAADSGDGFLFGGDGRIAKPEEILPPLTRLFQQEGEWVHGPLDSRIYRCPWDNVELELSDLPAGSIVEVMTFTADEQSPDGGIGRWDDVLAVTGAARDPAKRDVQAVDGLIGSLPGRFLWVKVRFRSDGFSTPSLKRLTIRFPRQSYLEHLPAVFSEDEAGRRFLECFLAVFQKDWDALEENVRRLPRLLDPIAADSRQLDFLASWLGVTFDRGWKECDRRKLLQAMPDILFARRNEENGNPGGTRRGTLSSLSDYLKAVLPGIASRSIPGYPVVIEGFRRRNYRTLGGGPLLATENQALVEAGADSAGAPLWSPSEVGRFQLGESSRLDEDRLVPAGAEEFDWFAFHAHRFEVVVPAALIDSAGAEEQLRRAVNSERPAHTAYDLCLVGERFRIGVQSTIGVDTILGGIPLWRLSPASGGAGPPSAPPVGRIGYDTVLSPARSCNEQFRLGGGARLGAGAARL